MSTDPLFFVSGGTLPLSAESYVERAADRALFDALSKGRYAYVLNARQMGKSSLCVRTIARLEAEGIRTAFVDLTRIGGRNVTPDQWYVGLLGEIGRAVGARAGLVAFWKENPDLAPMQRFFGALANLIKADPGGVSEDSRGSQTPGSAANVPDPGGVAPLVVFVDEVDATRSLPFSADEFFGGVRECFNRRAHDPAFERLTFCLLGAAIPSDLIRDMEASPFNVGERIAIQDFTLDEATAFSGPLSPPGERRVRRGMRSGAPQAEGGEGTGHALVARVHHWTAGHPFLTQSLCRRLAEISSPLGEGRVGVTDVDRLVETDLFAPSARESNVNLADVGNRVLLSSDGDNPDRHRAEILSLYDRIRRGKRVEDDESNPRVAILKLSGLVVAENGLLKVRNRIYARVFGAAWVAEHMPDGEARRVRRAYRVGLLRAAGVGGALVLAMTALAGYALGQARDARLANDATRRKSAEIAGLNTSLQASAQRLTEALADARTNLVLAQRRQREATDAKGAALHAATQATAAARREGLARHDALLAADRANASALQAKDAALEAGRQTLVARDQTQRADVARSRAEELLYTSNLQLVGDALTQGSGVRAAALLGETKAPDGRPSWAERHYRAVLREDALYPGHVGRVGRVAFAPNGDVLTLDGYEVDETTVPTPLRGHGTLRRWSRRTGRLDGTLDLRGIPGAFSMDLTPDGKTAVVAFADGSLRRYATDDFRLLSTARGAGAFIGNLQATLQPDRVLAWQGMSQVALSLTDAAPPQTLETHLGSAALDGVRTFLLPDGDLLRTSIEGRFRLARFSPMPDGGYRMRWLIGTGSIHTLAVSPDARWIAYASNGSATLVEAATGIARPKPIEHPATLYALAFSPDGKILATGSDDGTTKLTDVESGKTIGTLAVRHPGVTSIAFAPDGASLAIGSGDGTAELRSLDRAAGPAGAFPLASAANGVSASRAGTLLSNGTDSSLRVIDPKTGKDLYRFALGSANWNSDIAPDGRTVAAIERNGRYRAWDAKTGKPLCDVPGLLAGNVFNGITIGAKGLALVYVGGPGCWNGYTDPSGFALINARTGRLAAPRRSELGYFADGRLAPDGTRFALARQIGSATVYDAKTALPLFDLPDRRGDKAARLAYSPDGRLIAIGRRSGWVDLYQAQTGRPIRSWSAHSGGVRALALSYDGRTLTSLGEDKTRRTWDVRTGRNVGVEAVADPGWDIWFGVGDESVYFADGGQVQARRVGGDLAPIPPAPQPAAWPDPRVAMRDAEARARRRGKPILLFLRPEHDYPSGRVVDPLLANPDALAILRRRFEVVAESADGVHRADARARPNAGYWRTLLGEQGALPYTSISILSSQGRPLWNDRIDPASKALANVAWISVPLDEPQVDAFVRALRRASPAMTPAEAERVRAVAVRDGRRFVDDMRTQAQDAALDGRIQKATKERQTDEALALLDERRRSRPLDVKLSELFANAVSLTPNERTLVLQGGFAKAADEIVRRIDEGEPASENRLELALALFSVADDAAGVHRANAAMPPNRLPLDIAFEAGLAPDPGADLNALIARLDASRSDDETNLWYPALRGLLTARAGRPVEAEAAIRDMIAHHPQYANANPAFKMFVQTFLAFSIAKQGRAADARAAFAVAEGMTQIGKSDAELLAGGGYDTAYLAALRHEVRDILNGG